MPAVMKPRLPSIWIGTESQQRMFHDSGLMLGQSLFFWTGHAEEKPMILETSGYSGGPHDIILFAAGMRSTITGEIFDERSIALYASEGLEQKITGIWMSANGYALFEPRTSGESTPIHWFPTIPSCPWPPCPNGGATRWMGSGSLGLFRIDWSSPRKLKDARLRRATVSASKP